MLLDAKEIYEDILPLIPIDWIHSDQILRACASIAANISEGNGKKLKTYKYHTVLYLHARGSAFETITWLDLALIEGLIDDDTHGEIVNKLHDICDKLKVEIEKAGQ